MGKKSIILALIAIAVGISIIIFYNLNKGKKSNDFNSSSKTKTKETKEYVVKDDVATLDKKKIEYKGYDKNGKEYLYIRFSEINGTIIDVRLLNEQFYQDEKEPLPGVPARLIKKGPMELITTWKAKFLPFQTPISDFPDDFPVFKKVKVLKNVTVLNGNIQVSGSSLSKIKDPYIIFRGKAHKIVKMTDNSIVPDSDFLEELTGSDGKINVTIAEKEKLKNLTDVYHFKYLGGNGKDTFKFVWPDPQKYFSYVYMEKIYKVVKDYTISLKINIYNFGPEQFRHRLFLRNFGWSNPSKKGGGFFAPSPDIQHGACSVDGDVERKDFKKVLEEPFVKEGILDWIGIETHYFLTVFVAQAQENGQCVIKSYKNGLIQSDFYPRVDKIVQGTQTTCFPDWFNFSDFGGESCSQVKNKLSIKDGISKREVLKKYIEIKSKLSQKERNLYEKFFGVKLSSYKYLIFTGPKDIGILSDIGHNLDSSLDFWIVGFISKPLLYLLRFFYSIIPHWGVAIILLTIFVKILLLYFNHKSFVQMREMQKLKPELDKLKEKYKNDRQKLQQETMNLYKRHHVNPLGGCLPMLIQMPIYIALYRTIYTSVELYHAPLFLWIRDLSAPDPYFILPILMGVFMFIQQKLTPTTMEQAQQKMMMYIMPIMFTVFMLFLPSGLVLYILVNTILSLIQQYFINKPKTSKESA